MSVGFDHIDIAACRERGIKLSYTPDVLTEATAELTIALLLATSRRLFEAQRTVIEGNWKEWEPLWMCGQCVQNSVVGIVGLGRIDVEVNGTLTDFHILLKESDFVIVCASSNKENENLFNRDAFVLMKPNCILINTSRGALVNQQDLYVALKSRQIKAAGLDVCVPEPLPTDHQLLQLPNCGEHILLYMGFQH
ncbi:unnamed protein product [Soboliphyme baturini]|uniref:Glyoxylate reductase/hydroxypyruvate reductase n=1 Tax=Soboliphyme baturini TaxID=241478 RepID=A0A183IDJ0_9BILA|nr:unnamed protein product [Soboliphyme baturini]